MNLINPGRENRVLPVLLTEVARLERGDLFHHVMAGGGGYGDPLDRDPLRVLKDVIEEKVSPRACRRGLRRRDHPRCRVPDARRDRDYGSPQRIARRGRELNPAGGRPRSPALRGGKPWRRRSAPLR